MINVITNHVNLVVHAFSSIKLRVRIDQGRETDGRRAEHRLPETSIEGGRTNTLTKTVEKIQGSEKS